MATGSKTFITANELSEILGVSKGHAYKMIRSMNDELKKLNSIYKEGY